MIRPLLLLTITIVLAASCRTHQVATAGLDERMLDTLTVTPEEAEPIVELPVYHAAADKQVDLYHTALDLRFDWEEQTVIGQAMVQAKPVFYPQDSLTLDAVGFEIYGITGDDPADSLAYRYDGKKLRIALDKTYQKGQLITVHISYTAHPNSNDIGGSSAITSDKGLFFIDPLDQDSTKPSQIWTQGETEHNSRWMPTIDKPNQRSTQSIKLTVDTAYTTLSNGTLRSSTIHEDGTRTDHWEMDQPHAPYLFMIAVGKFAVVSESWRSKPVDYYVEPDYKAYAKNIFNHTPEMLTFFSDLLDYEYPWDKYAQVVTRDYVSGAMENTTAVIFGEFVQKTDRQLIDNHNDAIVAHEMFHHWFGDLVTCESWANLTLNEGFANYSEYLWFEHKYGTDYAEEHRHNERDAYFQSAQMNGIHPLIHYSYDSKEDMFDAHSYNKGGLVLHMLRDQLGDEAFFAALHKYLVDNAFSAVEVDELRLAFEDVTGLDLQWFFNQWYLTQGHPILDVSYGANEDLGFYSVIVSQTQDPETVLPIFRLPLDIALYEEDGTKHLYEVEMTQRDQLFLLNVDYSVAYATIDDDYTLLAEINEPEKKREEYAAQVKYDDNYTYRVMAYEAIEGTSDYYRLARDLIEESYSTYRLLGVAALDVNRKANQDLLAQLAESDPNSKVRAAALGRLADTDYEALRTLATTTVVKDPAYPPVEAGLSILSQIDAQSALALIEQMKEVDQQALTVPIAEVYAATGDSTYVSELERMITTTSIYEGYPLFGSYVQLAVQQPLAQVHHAVDFLEPLTGSDQLFTRYATVEALAGVRDYLATEASSKSAALLDRVKDIIRAAIDSETNAGVKGAMTRM